MSSLARLPRIIRGAHIEDEPIERAERLPMGRAFRAAEEEPGAEEVFVIGHTQRQAIAGHPALATVAQVLQAAEARAAGIIADAEAAAAAMIAEARAQAGAIRAAAQAEGAAIGEARARTAVEAEAAEYLALLRDAANEGLAVRNTIAGQAEAVLAEAVQVAMRRLTADWYDADPDRTAAICEAALQSAAGQEVLALRTNPSAAEAVGVALGTLAGYVVPDDAVAIGGCIIDLRNGTIDATLDTRLDLMALALERAGGDR